MEVFIHNIHYILSHIPHLEGSDENSDYEMWSRSGDCLLVFSWSLLLLQKIDPKFSSGIIIKHHKVVGFTFRFVREYKFYFWLTKWHAIQNF
jgi:hypothetical protein